MIPPFTRRTEDEPKALRRKNDEASDRLSCSFLVLLLCSVVSAQSQPRKRSNARIKKSPGQIVDVRPDLRIGNTYTQCYNHTARVVVYRTGGPLPRSFVARLWVFRGAALIEEIKYTIAPFTEGYKYLNFQTRTELRRNSNSDPNILCQFFVDPDNQIQEKRENNNWTNKYV